MNYISYSTFILPFLPLFSRVCHVSPVLGLVKGSEDEGEAVVPLLVLLVTTGIPPAEERTKPGGQLGDQTLQPTVGQNMKPFHISIYQESRKITEVTTSFQFCDLESRVKLRAPLGVLQQERAVDLVQGVVERGDRGVHHGGDKHVLV